MLSFFPRGVLDEILNLIESVSEGFPSYSFAQTIRMTSPLVRNGLTTSAQEFCRTVNVISVESCESICGSMKMNGHSNVFENSA